MAQNSGANVLGTVSNMQPTQSEQPSATGDISADKLLEMKKLLDAGAITQEEYDQVKAKILGL